MRGPFPSFWQKEINPLLLGIGTPASNATSLQCNCLVLASPLKVFVSVETVLPVPPTDVSLGVPSLE